MSRSKRVLAAGALGVALLAGCANQPAGAAAVVGGNQIAMADVTSQLQAIYTTLGAPADTADAQLTNAVVRNNIVYQLVEQAAQEAGVTVTQTEVDTRLAGQLEFVGSQAVLEQQAAQAGVAPEMIETDIRVSLLAAALAEQLGAGRDLTPQEQEGLLVGEIQQFSVTAGTTVNPRFGVWDVSTLSVAPDPASPSRPAQNPNGPSLLDTP